MKSIRLLDESLEVQIFYEKEDCGYEDNICLKITESCPDEEKIFVHDESHLYLTPDQARNFAEALMKAVEKSGKKNL